MLPNTFLYIQSLIQINRVKGKFNYFWKFVLQPLNGVPAVLCMWLQFNSFWDSFILFFTINTSVYQPEPNQPNFPFDFLY